MNSVRAFVLLIVLVFLFPSIGIPQEQLGKVNFSGFL